MVITIPQTHAQQAAYSITVNVTDHRFGVDSVYLYIKTENGHDEGVWVKTAQAAPSYTFAVGPNEGNTLEVCAENDMIGAVLKNNCETFPITGSNMALNISPGQ